MAGRLEVITGPMYSGKTEELLRRLRREEVAGKSVILFKHNIDDRYSESEVKTHNGSSMKAINSHFGVQALGEDYDVIGIDEAQFFIGAILLSEINFLVQGLDKKVIVTGLDMDFRREPFGIVPTLMALADRVDKLSAVCQVCGEDAIFTQRLIDGVPTTEGDTILVGGKESYEARCRKDFTP